MLTDNFINTTFNCDNSNNIVSQTVTVSNNINNINVECLVVPSRVFNGNNKKSFILSLLNKNCIDNTCSKTSHHGFQIFPYNLLNNDIQVDVIKPNFFSIINTKLMNPNGTIKLLDSKKKIKLIKIDNLNNNDSVIKLKDQNGNLCHDPSDKNTLGKFTYGSVNIIPNNILSYTGNPIIYFFGDYNACNMQFQLDVNNLYIYLDYGSSANLNTCLNKMKFYFQKSGNNTLDFKLPHNMHGTEYNDNVSRNFIINFNPRDISFRDGFITIIKTDNTDTNLLGNVSFSDELLTSLKTQKRDCLYVRFWTVEFNFKDNKLISMVNKNGPYKYINYLGNPKIIIYIPPYKDAQDKNFNSLVNTYFQQSENTCDVYVNLSY